MRAAKLAHSLGSVGDALDNAVVESFWARMQTELLDTRRWRTRTELSTEIFDWIEVFYNRTRRHSALGMLAPIAYEKLHADTPAPPDSCKTGPRLGGQTRWTDDWGPVRRRCALERRASSGVGERGGHGPAPRTQLHQLELGEYGEDAARSGPCSDVGSGGWSPSSRSLGPSVPPGARGRGGYRGEGRARSPKAYRA